MDPWRHLVVRMVILQCYMIRASSQYLSYYGTMVNVKSVWWLRGLETHHAAKLHLYTSLRIINYLLQRIQDKRHKAFIFDQSLSMFYVEVLILQNRYSTGHIKQTSAEQKQQLTLWQMADGISRGRTYEWTTLHYLLLFPLCDFEDVFTVLVHARSMYTMRNLKRSSLR